ncbi:hypothetical protein Q5O14_00430 [Eubacteriaceae bacterium ES2]|nr:hypothetical protein Q5O14_00430 [Eubacteriaceae bacterium ES2]
MLMLGLVVLFSQRDLTVVFVFIGGGLLIAEGVMVMAKGLLKTWRKERIKNGH